MLSESQLSALTDLFHHGADDASAALSRWLERSASVSIDAVAQLPLAGATGELGHGERPVCCCAMQLSGAVTGHLLLIVDDAGGLALADLLLQRPVGESSEWGEVEKSAALETANIIGCAYLNALARSLPAGGTGQDAELLPSPPQFVRDYAESVLQFALMDQAMASDMVFLTRTAFRIEDAPIGCSLLFVPGADCLRALCELLPDGSDY